MARPVPHPLAKLGGEKWYLAMVPTSLSFDPHSNPRVGWASGIFPILQMSKLRPREFT